MIQITLVKLSEGIPFQKQFLDLVSIKRKLNILKFKNSDDKKRSLIAELLIRKAANEKLNIPLDKVKISYNPYGRPYIDNVRHFKFNISHSSDFIVIATGKYCVGIDIEKIKATNEDIAKRFFTKNECNYIDSFNTEKEKAYAFYKIWTLKESYIKALGKGLNIPLNSFDFDIKGDDIVVKNNQQKYKFSTTQIYDYVLSLCSKGECADDRVLMDEQDFYNVIRDISV